MSMLWSKLSMYVAGSLGALLLVSNTVWYITYQAKDHTLSEERWAHSKTILNYEKAQDKAAIISYENKIKEDAVNAKKAQEADAAYASLLNKYNASIVRYKASQREAGTIDLSSTSTVTDGNHKSSESTRILITINDAQICAENTARIKSVHDWGVEQEKKNAAKERLQF